MTEMDNFSNASAIAEQLQNHQNYLSNDGSEKFLKSTFENTWGGLSSLVENENKQGHVQTLRKILLERNQLENRIGVKHSRPSELVEVVREFLEKKGVHFSIRLQRYYLRNLSQSLRAIV